MAKKKKQQDTPPAAGDDAAVASDEANARLKHTDELRDQAEAPSPASPAPAAEQPQGSITTRDDATDLGAPMLQGDPSEGVGPEDALGPGPTRGDYRERLGGDGYHPHEGPVPQRPRADEIGEVEGKKGGVETA